MFQPRKIASGAQRPGLEIGTARRPFWRRRWVWGVAAAGVVAIAAGSWFFGGSRAQNFVTQPVAKGELIATVSATGTLKPKLQVDLGAEISGRIDEVFVDFNAVVAQGQPLAKLNTDQLDARAVSSRANVVSARAGVTQAEATLADARRAFDRSRELATRGNVSDAARQSAESTFQRASAALEIAKAQVSLAESQLKVDESNLAKALIVAPIAGIVLDRKIEPGQTVAASFQTPILFTLASDLAQMELKVDIDEASVGQVKPGQPATFSVSAYPGRQFPATFVSLRNAPRVEQGVVSYEGILQVDNADLALKPGMTATTEITISSVADALIVPNTALRFVPPGTPEEERTVARDKRADTSASWGRVWVQSAPGAKPEPRDVTLGGSDGRRTQVLSGDLKEGDLLAVDIKRETGK